MPTKLDKKDEIKSFLSHKETSKRIIDLFRGEKEKAEKFKATFLQIALDDSLAGCTNKSIMTSALSIASLNLEIDKQLGQAYIVRYKRDAEAVIGTKGWLVLAKRAGYSVAVDPVFKCDEFSIEGAGFNKKTTFIPNIKEREDANPLWVADNLIGIIVSTIDSKNITLENFVSASKIKQIANKSPSRNSNYSPYKEWILEMYFAKAIKYTLSRLALDLDISRAIALDNKTAMEESEEKPLKKFDSFVKEDDFNEIEVEATNITKVEE
jgi:recombination protein RecT